MKDVIILPTFNERENIGNIVPLIFSTVPDIHILVADDNSPDGTGGEVLDLQKKYPNLSLLSRKHKDGLGRAYINAFNHVLKDKDVRSIIMMDADLSHQPKYLPEMLKRSQNFDVVVGSRYVKGGETVGWELWRRVLSFFGNLYCRIITWMPINDCTTGFNVINTDLLRKVDFSKMDMSGYAFIMELKYQLYTNGGKFFEVPITFVNRVGGESKISNHIINEGIIAPWKMRFKTTGKITKKHNEKIICPLCDNQSGLYFMEKKGYKLYKCSFCKLLFIYPLPKSIQVYDKSYFSGAEKGFGYVDYDVDKEPMIPTFEKYFEIISSLG